MGFLAPHTERIYAAFRFMAGLMFVQHGFQKLFGWFGGTPDGSPAAIVYGAGTIELAGGALVALGLFAGPAAFIASGTMAFAFAFHAFVISNPKSIFPIVNQGELAALYCFAFLFIAAKGSGIWSVDAARAGR
ncbi:MAG: DoxX family protein [Deltaproteobacteria bacterium]|nr:DoxX family protein [Deltaproteobacteria bacterium]